MSEVTTGVRGVLSSARVYELWSSVVGAHRGRTRLVGDHVRPCPGERVLDLGCGPGELLPYLGEVRYVGLDISPAYIARARERFAGSRRVRGGGRNGVRSRPWTVDLVVAFGVLHHLDDGQVERLFARAVDVLAPGGRVVTVDPVLAAGQSRVARALIRRDRGQHCARRGVRCARSRALRRRPRGGPPRRAAHPVFALHPGMPSWQHDPVTVGRPRTLAIAAVLLAPLIGIAILRAPLVNAVLYRDPWFYSGYGWDSQAPRGCLRLVLLRGAIPGDLADRLVLGPLRSWAGLSCLAVPDPGWDRGSPLRVRAAVLVANCGGGGGGAAGRKPVLSAACPMGLHLLRRAARHDRRRGVLVRFAGGRCSPASSAASCSQPRSTPTRCRGWCSRRCLGSSLSRRCAPVAPPWRRWRCG